MSRMLRQSQSSGGRPDGRFRTGRKPGGMVPQRQPAGMAPYAKPAPMAHPFPGYAPYPVAYPAHAPAPYPYAIAPAPEPTWLEQAIGGRLPKARGRGWRRPLKVSDELQVRTSDTCTAIVQEIKPGQYLISIVPDSAKGIGFQPVAMAASAVRSIVDWVAPAIKNAVEKGKARRAARDAGELDDELDDAPPGTAVGCDCHRRTAAVGWGC
jgi:hypothetical protein